jgi:uncharacterized protein YdeI (BOF family)
VLALPRRCRAASAGAAGTFDIFNSNQIEQPKGFMEPDANTSSVTATMSSPTVVLMILRGRIMSPRYAAISVAR